MQHDAATRAAVLADILVGLSIRSAAAKHRVSPSTAKQWYDRALADGSLESIEPPIERGTGTQSNTPPDDLGELFGRYFHANLRALGVQSDLFADRAWLEKQTASDILAIHRDLAERTIRLFAAMRQRDPAAALPGGDSGPPEGDPP